MQRRFSSLCTATVLVVLALGMGACSSNKIIPVNNGDDGLKNPPAESKQDQKLDAAQVHTQLGAQLMKRGDLKDAYDKLKMATQFDDSYAPAHTLLAILDEQLKQNKEAEQEYRRALAIDPKNGDANNNLGVFLCKTGRQAEAMQHFQRALADPFYKTPAMANTNAGKCLSHSNPAAADPYLRKALAIDPNYPDALLQMAQTLYARNDAFRARGFLQRFEAQGQASAESLMLGYRIESRLGDTDAARSYVNRLRSQFPNSEQAQQLAGTIQ